MTTPHKITFKLDEFDLVNVEKISRQCALNRTDAIHHALNLTSLSIDFLKKDVFTVVRYSTFDGFGHTGSINHREVVQAYNDRPAEAQKSNIIMQRSTPALQHIADIKNFLKVKEDSTAIGYALSYTAACIDKMQQCPGSRKRLQFINGNNTLAWSIKSPLNMTLSASFGKASRRIKRAIRKFNPLRSKPPSA